MANTKFHRISIPIEGDSSKLVKAAALGNKSLKGLDQGFSSLTASMGKLDGSFAALGGGIGSLRGNMARTNVVIGAATTAFTALSAAMAVGLREYANTEQALFKTEAILKATGNAAGFTVDQMDEMARSLARSTLASTQGIRDAQNVLLTFTSISGPEFQRTIALAQDMSAVFGVQATSAATQLGKALQDPVAGLSSLRKVGISFSQDQQDVIKNLAETGKTAAAQGEILKVLEAQIGGAGAAESGGLKGAFDSLAQASGELVEKWVKTTGIGEKLTNTVNSLAASINAVTANIDEAGTIEYYEREIAALEKIIPLTVQARKEHAARLADYRENLFYLKQEKQENEAQAKADFQRAENERQADVARKARKDNELALDKLINEEIKVQTQLKAEAARQEQQRIGQFEAVRQSLLSATQAETENHLNRMAILEQELVMRPQMAMETNTLIEAEEQRHQQVMTDISNRGESQRFTQARMSMQQRLGVTAGIMGNIATLMQTENRKMFEVGKVAAYASTVVNTAAGIMRAYKDLPYWLAVPASAAIAVAGAVQLATIKSQQFSASGSIGSGGGSSPAGSPPATTPVIPLEPTRPATQIHIENVNGNTALELIEELRETINNGDFVLIEGTSANAQLIRGD